MTTESGKNAEKLSLIDVTKEMHSWIFFLQKESLCLHTNLYTMFIAALFIIALFRISSDVLR
jgi:hypothetical protein